MMVLTCMWNLKERYKRTIYKTDTDSQEHKVGWEVDWELVIDMCTLLRITDKARCVAQGAWLSIL